MNRSRARHRPATFVRLLSAFRSRRIYLACIVLAVQGLSTAPTLADFRTEGATIRLVAEPPDEAGHLRGAILFDLEPGWKTYWRDPGESGLAPHLSFTGSTGVEPPRIAFPTPERLGSGAEAFNGYDDRMAIAFTTTGRAAGRLVLSLQAGLCSTLCVPVSASLTRDLSEALPLEDAVAIDRAFLALPRAAEGVAFARIEGAELVVELPSDTESASDLFVAGPPGWRFAAPSGAQHNTLRVPIRQRPAGTGAPDAPLEAVVVDDSQARTLTIELH